MNTVHTADSKTITTTDVRMGTEIPPLRRTESDAMSAEEMTRFITLIESLSGSDWDAPTDCTLWTVKDIVAHQAAHVVGFTGLGRFMGQLAPGKLYPYLRRGMGMLDAWNQSQVDLRRDATPQQLIDEIRSAAQASLSGRKKVPGLLRAPAMPAPGLDQPRSAGYMFDVVYTRDMWMHRHDIHSAIGRPMPLDDTHDRRMVALIVRDLAMKARRGLGGRAAQLTLTGPAGDSYHIGAAATPEATIEIDTLQFCLLTSGRSTAADVLNSGAAVISGDAEFGRSVLHFSDNRVLY